MTRFSEITTEGIEHAEAAASAGKRAGQAVWKATRAFGQAAPRIVAALLLIALVTVPASLYFGLVRVPAPDATLQTQIDGAAAEIAAIKADIATLAPKGDVAALAARVQALETARPAPAVPLTTGSIARPKK